MVNAGKCTIKVTTQSNHLDIISFGPKRPSWILKYVGYLDNSEGILLQIQPKHMEEEK